MIVKCTNCRKKVEVDDKLEGLFNNANIECSQCNYGKLKELTWYGWATVDNIKRESNRFKSLRH